MSVNIESLEGRTLFAAGAGVGGAALLARAVASADPAVQATLELVRADGQAIEAARQQLRADSGDTRPALKDVVRTGAELLAADRRAVLESRDDAAALEAARAKLKADRQQVREDVAAARAALRDDTADGRAALREATTSLRAHLRQLRVDLRNAAGGTTAVATGATAAAGATDGSMPAAGETVAGIPEDRVHDVVDRVEGVVDNATRPNEELVRTLVNRFVDAVEDDDITDAERDQLRTDVRAVLSSANISPDDLRAIADEVRDIVGSSDLSLTDLARAARIVGDVLFHG